MSLHDAYKHVQYCRNIICPNIGFFQQMIDLEHKVRFFLIPRSGSDFHSSRQSRRIGTAHCILRLMAGIPFGSILHRASFNSDQSHDLSGSHKYLIHLRRSRVSPGPLLSLPGSCRTLGVRTEFSFQLYGAKTVHIIEPIRGVRVADVVWNELYQEMMDSLSETDRHSVRSFNPLRESVSSTDTRNLRQVSRGGSFSEKLECGPAGLRSLPSPRFRGLPSPIVRVASSCFGSNCL